MATTTTVSMLFNADVALTSFHFHAKAQNPVFLVRSMNAENETEERQEHSKTNEAALSNDFVV